MKAARRPGWTCAFVLGCLAFAAPLARADDGPAWEGPPPAPEQLPPDDWSTAEPLAPAPPALPPPLPTLQDAAPFAPDADWSEVGVGEAAPPVTTFLPPPLVRTEAGVQAEGYDVARGLRGPALSEPPFKTVPFPGRTPPRGTVRVLPPGPTARIFEATVRHDVELADGRRGVEFEVVCTGRSLLGRPILVGIWFRDPDRGDRRVPASQAGYTDAQGRLTVQSIAFTPTPEGARHAATLRVAYESFPRRLDTPTWSMDAELQVLLLGDGLPRPLATARVPLRLTGDAGRTPTPAGPVDPAPAPALAPEQVPEPTLQPAADPVPAPDPVPEPAAAPVTPAAPDAPLPPPDIRKRAS